MKNADEAAKQVYSGSGIFSGWQDKALLTGRLNKELSIMTLNDAINEVRRIAADPSVSLSIRPTKVVFIACEDGGMEK